MSQARPSCPMSAPIARLAARHIARLMSPPVAPLLVAIVVMFLAPASAQAVERFPPPDFESGYKQLDLAQPPAAGPWLDIGHVAALAAGLVLATWLALRRRSRHGLIVLSVGSLAYFGFYLQGCVCPIGSIQNVTLALADASYVLPLTIVATFALPVIFALLFGRVFCSSVCPLGAIQDLVLIRPRRLPQWLSYPLSFLPYLYLGLAVLVAGGGGGFIICEYDPFVAFFRRTGSAGMLIYGGTLLALGLVIGRPYCRFLCPYGALLGLCSRVARWHVTTSPDDCVNCRLCEQACPYDAIEAPTDPADPRVAAVGQGAANRSGGPPA